MIDLDIHDRGGLTGMSGIDHMVWEAHHPMYQKEDNSDAEGEEKEEEERKETKPNRNLRIARNESSSSP